MIKSNLGSVIDKMKRVKAELPVRIQSNLDAEKYISRLKFVAQTVLESSDIFETEAERGQIPLLVETITGDSSGNKMEFLMRATSVSEDFPSGFDSEGNPVWDEYQNMPQEKIVEWVATLKIKKNRDRDKNGNLLSNEDIADNVMGAIRADPDHWLKSTNPTGLARFLGAKTGLSDEKIARALLKILAEWKKGLAEIIPMAIRLSVRAALQ